RRGRRAEALPPGIPGSASCERLSALWPKPGPLGLRLSWARSFCETVPLRAALRAASAARAALLLARGADRFAFAPRPRWPASRRQVESKSRGRARAAPLLV